MSKGGKIFAIFSSLLGIALISKLIIEINKLINFDYNFVDYKIKGIDNKYIYIDLKVNVINPSALEVIVLGYFINVFLNDKFVANLSSKQQQIIKKKAYSPFILPLKIDYVKSFGAVKSAEILNYFSKRELDKVYFTFKGNFLVKVLGIEYKAKIEEKVTLAEIEEEINKPE